MCYRQGRGEDKDKVIPMWDLNGTLGESHPGFSSSIVESAPISATVLSPVTEGSALRLYVAPAFLPLVAAVACWHWSCTGVEMSLSPFSSDQPPAKKDAGG
jgi:hypothetical protein